MCLNLRTVLCLEKIQFVMTASSQEGFNDKLLPGRKNYPSLAYVCVSLDR
jgi:hypothetical protein